MAYFFQQLLNALQLGSIYALIALGYTMVYGILTMINFAHGDLFMVGAFFCFLLAVYLKLSFVPTLLLSMLGVACLGSSSSGWPTALRTGRAFRHHHALGVGSFWKFPLRFHRIQNTFPLLPTVMDVDGVHLLAPVMSYAFAWLI
jgi:branched-chain amino acid transport system permease protein